MPQVLAILVGISLMMAVKPKHAANYKWNTYQWNCAFVGTVRFVIHLQCAERKVVSDNDRYPNWICHLSTFRGPCNVIYSYNKTNEMH
jgi:hypothetical protein